MTVLFVSPAVLRAAAVASLAALLYSPVLAAAKPQATVAKTTQPKDCFDELENGTSPEFVCNYPVALADQERGDLKRITRDYLQDVTCAVSVRIDRGLVERAVQDIDYVFESPPQPVTCDVKTSKSNIHITATFSPRVTFKGGQAIDGSPGLENIQGVTRILSWPVKQYVNRAPHIRNTMLQIVNGYRRYWSDKHRQP